jgi:outer membrane protein OmpA-like peptidoglycan-associated protein
MVRKAKDTNPVRAPLHGIWVAAVMACGLTAPRPAAAQYTDGLARLSERVHPIDFSAETRLGAITPKGAHTGFDGSFEWNVGSIARAVRPLIGADVFYADVRRGSNGVPTRGSVTGVGALAGARLDVNSEGAISPYAVSGLAANYVWANASDPTTEHDLKGARLGFALGGGAAAWIGTLPLAATVDVRHVFAHQNARTMYSIGMRIQPRFSLLRKRLDGDVERVKGVVDDLLRLRGQALPDVENVSDGARGVEIALGDALFLQGTEQLSNRAMSELTRIGELLQRFPANQAAIDLRPHVARACADVRLARQRALVVRQKLIEAGVGNARLIQVTDVDEVSTPAGTGDVRTECRAATITVVGVHRGG